MALSGSLPWLPPFIICSQPAGALAVTGRTRIHLPRTSNLSQNAGLWWAVPWSPRRLRSRRIPGRPVHLPSIQAKSAQRQVEAVPRVLGSNGEDDGELLTPKDEVKRNSPRRRRRARKRVGEESNSTSVTQKRDVEEAPATEVSKGGSPGATFTSNAREAVEGSSLESGVSSRDNADAATVQQSSTSPSLREVPELQASSNVVNWATGAQGTTNSRTHEIEQGPKKTRKKRRRSKKSSETSIISNGTVDANSGVGEEDELVGRIFTGEEGINDGSTRSRKISELVGSYEGPVGLETTLITSAASENYSENVEKSDVHVSKQKTKKSKKKLALDQKVQRGSELHERQNGSGRCEDATENLVSNVVSRSSEGKEQSGPQSNNGQGSSKIRKRRRSRKTVGTVERITGSNKEYENAAENREGDSGGPELDSQSSQGNLGASGELQRDGGHKVAVLVPLLDSPGLETASNTSINTDGEVNSVDGDVNWQHDEKHEESTTFSRKGDGRRVIKSKGVSPHVTVVSNSLEVQNKILAAVSEGEESTRNDSSEHVKHTRRGGRRKQRKNRVTDSLQIESQSERIVPEANNLFDAIIWCTVHLKVRAKLEHNEHLFVVGANPELGGWDLSLALPLPESEEERGIWECTLKIPRGTMLEYKYFAEARDADSSIIERCFGPEIQYFLPWKEGQGSEAELIRDTWMPDIPVKLPLLSWGDRWWEEIDSVENEKDVGRYKGKELDNWDQQVGYGEVVDAKEEPLGSAEKKVETSTEQPELEEWLKRRIRKRVFPREEPWLLESMIMEQRNGSVRKKTDDAEANGEGIEVGADAFEADQKNPPVQVEILINSPQCTMQRMAILEDGKLVELLLEPVNTRVQVGNVYLGVVRQLLPGMTGVFVDIGGFQIALLDITRNQYPYTFPRIGQDTGVSGDQQLWDSFDNEEEGEWEGSELEDEDEDEHDDDFFDDEEEGEDGELDEEEEAEDYVSRGRSINAKVRVLEASAEDEEDNDTREATGTNIYPMARTDSSSPGPITVSFGRKLKKWSRLQEGMRIIVQVKKEALGKKGPRLTAFPSLAGRFWVLIPGGRAVGVSRRITGPERKRLRQLAQELLPTNFALTVRTEALGHDRDELEKDLTRLMETWKEVLECASAAAVAAEHGMDGAVPVLLHRAMGQTLTIVRDFFTNKVHRMVIDSPQCYQEVTSYLQEVAPQLSDRVELYTDKMPIFDAFDIESEIEKFSNKRVSLPNGGYLVIEETEALVSIDVNGGTGVLAHDVSQEEAILGVNLAAARQIATDLRLRDIGGIIVVDFIDMADPKSEKQVLDEMRKAISRDRSSLSLSEISEFGLMAMTRKRVRPSVTLTISDPCSHCVGVGRVEAHETTLSKIERAVRRLLATRPGQTNSLDSAKWPQLILRVDPVMGEYLKGRKRKRITQLSAALKVWLNLKVVLEFSMGYFQVREQHRTGSDKRPNGAGQLKSNQQKISPGLLGKRAVWPGKRRRNLANQVSNKLS